MKDEEIWAMILGGIIGAALVAPKPEERQELQEYRNLKQQIALRQQRVGAPAPLNKIISKPQIYNLFAEGYRTYLFGFFRSLVIICSALVEFLLKEKFGDKRFFELIELARKEDLITESEYYFLHGIRSERNDAVHNFDREIREEDSIIVLRIANKILDKLI
jgi:hypothetical protein